MPFDREALKSTNFVLVSLFVIQLTPVSRTLSLSLKEPVPHKSFDAHVSICGLPVMSGNLNLEKCSARQTLGIVPSTRVLSGLFRGNVYTTDDLRKSLSTSGTRENVGAPPLHHRFPDF